MLVSLITRKRKILATVLAIGAASLAGCAAMNGDSAFVIAELERKLGSIDEVLQRHTYELREAGASAPTDTSSRVLYRMTGQRGEVFYFEGPANPGTIDINRIADELFLKKNKQYVSQDSAWSEVQAIWSGLTETNQRIAKAKALRHFDARPSSVSTEDWEHRFANSERPWHTR
jgi:hypothetical protein